MRGKTRIGVCAAVLIVAVMLVPAVALAAPRADVQVPSWVTDAVNQVKAVAQAAADQLKPIVAQAKADAAKVASDTWAALKSAKSFADIKAALAQSAAQVKVIADGVKASAAPIVQAAAAQIKTIIDNAIAAAGGLPAALKAKVLQMLDALKNLVPVVPKVA
jgi:hypothetical protein